MRRRRPGLGWLLVLVTACAIAACVVLGMAQKVYGAELQRGELDMMVRIVQAETTGEPIEGQRAVANVMLNRLAAGTFGKTLTKVLLRPYQFAKPAPLDDISPSYLRAMLATVQALLRVVPDDSRGSTHFHLCSMKPWPDWARRLKPTVRISSHCFYR